MMPEIEYAQFLVVGRSDPDPLIDWRVWKEFVPLLDPIFEAARKPSLIRMYQETREDEESVTFGRLSWNEKSHAKWTHNSPVTMGKSSDWRFIAAEFWAPSPNLDNDDPDTFMHLRHREPAVPGHKLTYEVALHLIVSKQLPEYLWKETAPEAIRFIASKARALICATRDKPWHTVESPDWITAVGAMDYLPRGLPRWVETIPSLYDFPKESGWTALEFQ